MKNQKVALSVFVISIIMVACGPDNPAPEPDSQAAQVLKGEHKLRKMFSGSYFLFVPSAVGTQNRPAISFAWPLKDGTCAISSLPLEKIRIRFDEAAEEPTIKFAWRYENFARIDYLMEHSVIYATITIREKDWSNK